MTTRAPAPPPELRGYTLLEAGGDLLGDIGEGAADLWEEWTPW